MVDTALEKRLKFLAILKQSEDWFMSEVRLSWTSGTLLRPEVGRSLSSRMRKPVLSVYSVH